jgi:hypothetical protein
MKRIGIYVGVLVVLLLFALVFFVRHLPPPPLPPSKLAVSFVTLANNPTAARPAVVLSPHGATGLCAMFSVTNIAGTNVAKDPWIWFDTTAVELKTETGWQQIMPDANAWSGIAGKRWNPGYGCLFAVGWPPGIPTNATWCIRVRYGLEPSVTQIIANDKLNRELFHSGKEEQTIVSSEVKQ